MSNKRRKEIIKDRIRENFSQSGLWNNDEMETITVELTHSDSEGQNDLDAYLTDLMKLGADRFSDEAEYVVDYTQEGNKTLIDVKAPDRGKAEDIVYELVMDAGMSYSVGGSIEIDKIRTI